MTEKEYNEKYPTIIDGDESIDFPDGWKTTDINTAIVDDVTYSWKSPSVKGDKFYGWIRNDIQPLLKIHKMKNVGIPGLTAECIVRTKTKAIYFRRDGYYEIIIITIKEAETVKFPGGLIKYYPKREYYPANEDFGTLGWCCRDKKLAYERYNRLP